MRVFINCIIVNVIYVAVWEGGAATVAFSGYSTPGRMLSTTEVGEGIKFKFFFHFNCCGLMVDGKTSTLDMELQKVVL